MSGANATTRTPTVPPARPRTIHGRRIPSCDVVLSLSRPKAGLPTRATSNGVTSTRDVLAYAIAYRETKPQPTRAGAGREPLGIAPSPALGWSIVP